MLSVDIVARRVKITHAQAGLRRFMHELLGEASVVAVELRVDGVESS
jgi:hypothetical protein